jgi:hypothetical protein
MDELFAASKDQSATRRAQWRGVIASTFRFALDVALPPLCPSCREPLGDGVGLCAECWSKLSLIEPPYCARLGIPFSYDAGPGLLSMEAIANPPAYQRARAAVRYDDIARALVQAYKYGDRIDLAPLMAGWMARAGRELLADADALIPVPLHWRRLWARGSISRRRWRVKSATVPMSRCCTMCSSAPAQPRTRWDCRRRSALRMCRARSAFPLTPGGTSQAGASSLSTMY